MLKILSRYLVSLRKHLNVTKAWYFHKLAPVSYYHSEGDIKDLNTDNASDVCVEPSSKNHWSMDLRKFKINYLGLNWLPFVSLIRINILKLVWVRRNIKPRRVILKSFYYSYTLRASKHRPETLSQTKQQNIFVSAKVNFQILQKALLNEKNENCRLKNYINKFSL